MNRDEPLTREQDGENAERERARLASSLAPEGEVQPALEVHGRRLPRRERGSDPGTRTRIVALWMLGLAFLEVGHLVARVLVAFAPEDPQFRDPPLVVALVHAVSAVVWFLASRGLERGVRWARALVPVVVVGTLVGTYLAINTATIVPRLSASPGLRSLAESWRGVGWPGMLGYLGRLHVPPSGRWQAPDAAALGFATLVGVTVLWLLATGSRATAAARRAAASAVERGAGFVVAVHLGLHASLTITTVVGLLFRVAKRWL